MRVPRRGRGGPARRDGPVCSAGNYRTQMWDKQKEVFLPSTPGLGMHVEVKDPEGKVGPPRVALAYCIRPPFGGALWACGARRTCAVPGAFTRRCVAGGALAAVWLRGALHLHFPHPWRPSDLPALQLH